MAKEIKTKVCSKCKLELEFSCFYKNSRYKFGFISICKKCHKERQRAYCEANPEKISERDRAYRKANPEKVRERNRAYRKANHEKVREYQLNYYIENFEKISERHRAYRKANPEKIRETLRAWHKRNLEKVREASRAWKKKERKNNPIYVLKNRITHSIRESLKRKKYTKKSRTHKILGCDYETFAAHLEAQFVDGMNWDNRDKWHIDHIIPIASAKTEEDVLRLNHYSNLQPLWAKDNLLKRDKMPPVQIQQRVKRNHAKLAGVHMKLKQQSIFDYEVMK